MIYVRIRLSSCFSISSSRLSSLYCERCPCVLLSSGNTCQVTSCTAVTLVCGISCNSQDFAEVRWKKAIRFHYWSLAKALPNYNNRTTIQFRADDVTEGTSGYYKCYCYCGPHCRASRSLSSSWASIRLQVHPLPGGSYEVTV